MSSSEAFVTLATTDAYALGALTLAQSIRQVGTTRNLVVLVSNNLSELIKKSLETSFDEVLVVDELNSNDNEHLELLSRPELGITFTKINCWLLEQYTKCVFLDADCLVLKPIDQLFEREQLSAASDAGWPDCFNSGVFVYRPSKQTFQQLLSFASQQSSSFDGGDQGLLNSFFSDWRTADISRHLPFTYNVTANAFYSYLPAVTRFRNDIHIVHFAGALKPWQLTFNPQNESLSGNLNGQNDIQRDFLLSWWRTMQQKVWPKIQLINQQLNSNNQSNNQQYSNEESLFGSFNNGNQNNYQNVPIGSAAHRRAWESGNIDYFGRDSFQKIEEQLQKNIENNSYQYHPAHSTINTNTNQIKSALKQTTSTNGHQTTSSNGHQTTSTNGRQTSSNGNQTTSTVGHQTTSTVERQTPSNGNQTTSTVGHQTSSNGNQTTSTVGHQTTSTVERQTPSNGHQTTSTVGHQTSTNVHQTSSNGHQTTSTVGHQTPSNGHQTTSTNVHPKSTNVHQTSSVDQSKAKLETKQEITQRSYETVVINTTAIANQNSSSQSSKSILIQQTVTNANSSLDGKNDTTSSVHLKQVQPTITTTTTKSSSNDSQLNSSNFNLKSSNENATPLSTDRQASSTVKSTILTAYSQGTGNLTGPTVINKTVTTSTATSSASKQISDSTNAKVSNNSIANNSSDHFNWLFNKIYLAITYTITMCYLLFLVAIRRTKDTNIIHGTTSNVRNVPSKATTDNNGNRLKK